MLLRNDASLDLMESNCLVGSLQLLICSKAVTLHMAVGQSQDTLQANQSGTPLIDLLSPRKQGCGETVI